MLQFIKKAGRKRHIIKSPSLNIEHSDVTDNSSQGGTDQQILATIEQHILNDESDHSIDIALHSTKNIIRIVGDQNCLCHFVQYLEQKDALPLIRFWLDVESFKSSAEQCGQRRPRRLVGKSAIGRSVSLDGIIVSRDEFYNAYNDDVSSYNCEKSDVELPSERDNGDGSSDANSMTNLSDIYEHNDDELETLSIDEDGAQRILENGRKSATGASSHGDEMDAEKPGSKLASSLITDATRIFRKYLQAEELSSVNIPAGMLSPIARLLCEDTSSESSDMIVCIFDEVQSFILEYLDQMYTSDFLESPFYYRFCMENAGTNLKVTDILYNELALFYFMEFLELENKRNYLDFWLAAMNFRRQLNDIPTECNTIEQSQNDALILYEKYFSLQATCPLHLSDRVRFDVETKICSIDGIATISHCFDLPLAIIERFLCDRFLKPFERSPLFFKYFAELTQKMEAMSSKAHKPISSPHNAQFISAKNTLLAMGSVKKRKPADLCIEESDCMRNGGLKFGHVNEMGRYERDYELAPSDRTPTTPNIDANQLIQHTGNKIKQAVRKLAHLPEECTQEEIAWQMAEMIVRDITDVTLRMNQVPREAL